MRRLEINQSLLARRPIIINGREREPINLCGCNFPFGMLVAGTRSWCIRGVKQRILCDDRNCMWWSWHVIPQLHLRDYIRAARSMDPPKNTYYIIIALYSPSVITLLWRGCSKIYINNLFEQFSIFHLEIKIRCDGGNSSITLRLVCERVNAPRLQVQYIYHATMIVCAQER